LENEWLDEIGEYITQEQGVQIIGETARLKEVQATPDTEEALSKIPRLQISDLDSKLFTPPIKVTPDIFDSGVTTLEHELPFTNGIAYVDFAIDISAMDFDDVVLIPLFCSLLLKGGSKRYTDVQTQREIDKASGGIKIFPIIEEVVQTHAEGGYVVPDGKHLVTKIVVSGACVAANSCLPLMNVMKHLLWDSDVRNKDKAIEILEAMIDNFEDDIQNEGHHYTTQRIASRYSLPGFVREQWTGVTQVMQMRRALAKIRDDFSDLSLRLIQMQDTMKRGNRNGMVLSVTGDHQALKDLKGAVELFLKNVLPPAAQVERFPDFSEVQHPWVTKGMHRMASEISREHANQAFMVPTRVNHVGKGGLLYEPGERIKGSDEVVTQFLSGYYLYNQLRFNLGAQHAWAVLDSDSGLVIYQSDRDPNILQSLEIYEGGADWIWQQLHSGELTVEAKAAIVGAIGRLDGTAMQPNRVGIESIKMYLKQDSAESRQRWRNEIIGSKASDFIDMADRLGSWGDPSICVVTSSEIYATIEEDFPLTVCDYYGYTC
jgi:Zn-dependent M16 (insulinase) family peptidase